MSVVCVCVFDTHTDLWVFNLLSLLRRYLCLHSVKYSDIVGCHISWQTGGKGEDKKIAWSVCRELVDGQMKERETAAVHCPIKLHLSLSISLSVSLSLSKQSESVAKQRAPLPQLCLQAPAATFRLCLLSFQIDIYAFTRIVFPRFPPLMSSNLF